MSTLTVEMKPLAKVTQDAIQVLCQEIGLVDTIRFVNQFSIGYGNYTEERETLFEDLTMDDIITEIKRQQSDLTTTE